MISLIAVAMLFAASPIPQTPVRGIVSITSPQPDLVWYKLNEGSGTVRFDQSGNVALNLTINGSPSLTQIRGVGFQAQGVALCG